MRSTSSGSCVAASTRTLRCMIQCDNMVTMLMAEVGAKRRPPRHVAYRWCMPSPQWPPSWYVQRAPTAVLESGTNQYTPGCTASRRT